MEQIVDDIRDLREQNRRDLGVVRWSELSGRVQSRSGILLCAFLDDQLKQQLTRSIEAQLSDQIEDLEWTK